MRCSCFQQHTFNGVEVTLKKVSPCVASSLRMPELPEQTNEVNPTECSPEELAFKAVSVLYIIICSNKVKLYTKEGFFHYASDLEDCIFSLAVSIEFSH